MKITALIAFGLTTLVPSAWTLARAETKVSPPSMSAMAPAEPSEAEAPKPEKVAHADKPKATDRHDAHHPRHAARAVSKTAPADKGAARKAPVHPGHAKAHPEHKSVRQDHDAPKAHAPTRKKHHRAPPAAGVAPNEAATGTKGAGAHHAH